MELWKMYPIEALQSVGFFSVRFGFGGRELENGFNIQNVYHLLTNDPNKWQKEGKCNVSSLT